MNWFSPAEASLKRTLIQRLIFGLLKSSPEVSSAACSDEEAPPEFPVNNKNETCLEFLSGRGSPSIDHQDNISSCQAQPGLEMTLLSASSMSSQCVNNSGLVLKEFLESGATAGSLLGQYSSFDHPSSYYRLNSAISPSEVLRFFLYFYFILINVGHSTSYCSSVSRCCFIMCICTSFLSVLCGVVEFGNSCVC